MKKTLEKIVQSGKKVVAGALVAGTLLMNGCMAHIPVEKYKHTKNIYSEIVLRGGTDVGVVDVDLDPSHKYVPVHKDEGGPEAGGATLDMGKDVCLTYFKGGVQGSIGNKYLRLKVGADAKWHPDFLSQVGDDVTKGYPKEHEKIDGLSDIERYTDGSGWESYAYGFVERKNIIFIEPYASVGVNIADRLFVDAEIGIPKGDFGWETGWWRYNRFEEYKKDSWKGDGVRYGLNVGVKGKKKDDPIIGVTLNLEEFKAEFDNKKVDINNYLIGAYVNGEF